MASNRGGKLLSDDIFYLFMYFKILMSTSDSCDNCVDDCALGDIVDAVETEQELCNEHIGQGQGGQSTDSTSFKWEDIDNYRRQRDTVGCLSNVL
jgi:hypothetical protein